MVRKNERNSYRRVVTGHENGKSIIQSDECLEAYQFKALPGFEHTLLWENRGIPDLSQEQKPTHYPQSLIPGPGGSTSKRDATSTRTRYLCAARIRKFRLKSPRGFV
jgi:hypothetical protein